MLTLARNARTSVEMIERFYASELTGEMNIDAIQSQRKRKSKPASTDSEPADVKAQSNVKTASVRATVDPQAAGGVVDLPAISIPPLPLL
jgi:hypothetical protein